MANNRRIFIINPKFQFKFSFIICSLVFLGSLIYPITIYDLFEYLIAMNPGTASRFEEQRSSLLLYLTLTQVGFVGLVFVLCIFVSHKIVGPLYKLSMYLKGIREGDPVTGLNFREGDQFPEIADEINETIEYFTNKTEEELDYLEEISTYIENIALVVPEDKKPVLEEIQKKIKEFQGVHSN